MNKIEFYHLCTDGTTNGIVHTCPEDYLQAIIISAVLAYKLDISTLAYCHMSTHSHFVAACENEAVASSFLFQYKREYSKYLMRARGISNAFQGIDGSVKRIDDYFYLKKCITYTLLNPVAANLVKYPEDYQWSSFKAYFSAEDNSAIPVSSLSGRKTLELFHTKTSLKQCRYSIDQSGHLTMQSIVSHRFVESLFKSQSQFYKDLERTDSLKEESLYVSHVISYNDNELLSEAQHLSSKYFGTEVISSLKKMEKVRLAQYVMKKTRVSAKRVARVLRLDREELESLLGC